HGAAHCWSSAAHGGSVTAATRRGDVAGTARAAARRVAAHRARAADRRDGAAARAGAPAHGRRGSPAAAGARTRAYTGAATFGSDALRGAIVEIFVADATARDCGA